MARRVDAAMTVQLTVNMGLDVGTVVQHLDSSPFVQLGLTV
jgi:hypothetical protein